MPAAPATPVNVPTYGLTATGSYAAVVGADAPVHWWRCADPAGGFLHDVGSGPQRALTAVGGVAQLAYTGPASDGGSVWMDANFAAWHVSGDLTSSPRTVEGWVWLHTFKSGGQVLFGHYANMQTNAAGQVLWASVGANVTAPAVLTEQAWHHLVGTYGPISGAQLYIDGVSVANAAYGAADLPTTHAPTIGMSESATLFSAANIAEVATYNRELTAAQVAAHFAAADSRSLRPVSRSSGTWNATTGTPGLPSDPNAPGNLAALQAQVNLLQRQLVPFGYVAGTAHAGLVGSGTFAITGLLGIRVVLTTIPGTIVQDGSNPPFLFNVGWVSMSTADGFIDETRVHAAGQVWQPRIASDATQVGYSFGPGVVATITELTRLP